MIWNFRRSNAWEVRREDRGGEGRCSTSYQSCLLWKLKNWLDGVQLCTYILEFGLRNRVAIKSFHAPIFILHMQAVLSKHCDSFPNSTFAHGGIRDDEYLSLQILGIGKTGLGRVDQIGLFGSGYLSRLRMWMSLVWFALAINGNYPRQHARQDQLIYKTRIYNSFYAAVVETQRRWVQ